MSDDNFNSTADSEGHVPSLSIHDMVRLATLNLRGTSRQNDSGFIIEVRNYNSDLYISIELSPTDKNARATDFTVQTGSLKHDEITSTIAMSSLLHLYATWDTPGNVTFCFSSEDRYTMINVNHERGAYIRSGVDRRRQEKKENLSDEDIAERKDRRTFYHIGTLFKQGSTRVTQDDFIDTDESGD